MKTKARIWVLRGSQLEPRQIIALGELPGGEEIIKVIEFSAYAELAKTIEKIRDALIKYKFDKELARLDYLAELLLRDS